jgi:outer membrane protein insertion porin family
LFEEHQLEIRTSGGIGRHLPFHNELTTGGVTDLRGYATDRFRGDRRWVYRAEYSFPIFRTHGVALRGIGFFDGGYAGFDWRVPDHRNYLATEGDGSHWWANDAGAGIRVYIKQVVLPLLGLDVAYGIEGKRPELYFELGLTDF